MRMSIHFAFLLPFFFITMVSKTKTDDFIPFNCGSEKELNDVKGVIQTPNFPHAFPVPIRCRWVIDASNFTSTGDKIEIYVYMTQMFVRTGLNITEYKLYDKEAKIGYAGLTLLELPPPSGKEFQFVKSNLTYMVIDFQLDMLEGNHLRVLHGLMDVYGFNVTYEVSTTGERTDICTVNECSLVGHCFASADFSNYSCSCFKGFYGKNCGYGPQCGPEKSICANGAKCRYAGETTIICECSEGYTGVRCDIPVIYPSSPDSIYNVIECLYDKRSNVGRFPCNCKHPEYVMDNNDRTRYVLNVKLNMTLNSAENFTTTTTPLPNGFFLQRPSHKLSPEEKILQEIDKQIRRAKLNVKPSFLRLINSTKIPGLALYSYHFFGSKSDGNKVQDMWKLTMNKLVMFNATYSYQNESALRILMVSSNADQDTVNEGSEIILSCIAMGSSSLTFQWYKDGLLINTTSAIRGMWSSTEVYSDNKYAALLCIQRTRVLDSGIFTCQVKDWEQEQCKSVKVSVMKTAKWNVRPLYKTVKKGENLTILCQPKDSSGSKIFGYTWARSNRELVKMNVPFLYFEDLYEGGSVLHVNNIQKSETFLCNSESIRIDVLNKSRTPFCEEDGIWNVTIPGVASLHECPEDYSSNIASRMCLMVDANSAQWQLPDFSKCISNTFLSITDSFYKVTLGYQNNSVVAVDTLKALWSSLTVNGQAKVLYPGEGEPIVNLLKLVHEYLLHTRRWHDFYNSTKYFFNFTDLLLADMTSIVNQESVYKFADVIEKWIPSILGYGFGRTTFWNASHYKSFEFHAFSSQKQLVIMYQNISLELVNLLSYNKKDESARLGVILYKNLSKILLPKYISSYKKDRQLLYELTSPVVHFLLSETGSLRRWTENSSRFQVNVTFQLPLHRKQPIKWDVCCGFVPRFGKSWNLNVCHSITKWTRVVQCTVNRTGLFALFANEISAIDPEISRKYHNFVIIGCGLCFLQCIVSLCILFFRWLKIRSCFIYLKIQICASTAITMLLFLYGSCNPSTNTFPYILSGLQMFLLTSVSSHISILIIMYIDIITLKKIPNVNISAISVMTVSPMLLVVFASLSRKINDETLTWWWLSRGTLLFYVNFIVGLVFIFLFILLYCTIMKKLVFLWNANKVERKITIQRISIVHYTALIFSLAVFMIISSTYYVNARTSTSQCMFGSSCVLLGCAMVLFYIPKNEIFFCLKILFPSLKRDLQKYSPELHIIPVQSGILRNLDASETNSLSCHSHLGTENECLNVSSRQNLKKKMPVIFSSEIVSGEEVSIIEETAIDNLNLSSFHPSTCIATSVATRDVDGDTVKEKEMLWPVTQEKYISTSGCAESAHHCSPLHELHPEMLTTRVCVELGVMKKGTSNNAVPGDSSSTVVICSVDVEPCPGHIVELNEVKFTANAISSLCSETAQKLSDSQVDEAKLSQDSIEKEKADVLDRISQDLDYLLNRTPSPRKARSIKLLNNSQKLMENNNYIKPKI